MSNKSSSSRRNKASAWLSCSQCNLVFERKDSSLHACAAEGSREAVEHPLISLSPEGRFLRGPLQRTSSGHEREEEGVVFVSYDALRLLELSIESLVVVAERVLLRVWPSQQVKLCRLEVSPSTLSLHPPLGEMAGSGRLVSLLPYLLPLPILETLTLGIPGVPPAADLLGRNGLIRHLLNAVFIQHGGDVVLKVLGRPFTFSVLDYRVMKEEEPLSTQLQWLTLDSTLDEGGPCKAREELFFRVDPATRVTFETGASRDRKGERWFERPQLEWDQIAGMDAVKRQLEDVLKLLEQFKNAKSSFPPTGILLHGPAGSGKTLLRLSLRSRSWPTIVCVSPLDVFMKPDASEQSLLLQRFEEAASFAPSILWIEDIDALVSAAGTKESRRMLSLLSHVLDRAPGSGVVVIACTNSVESVPMALRRAGRLEREMEIPVPSLRDRQMILQSLGLEGPLASSVAELTPGFVGGDLLTLLRLASVEGGVESLDEAEIVRVLPQVKPSALREMRFENPKTSWTDIGGMEEVKKALEQSLTWPLKHPEAFKRLGIRPPKGLLMYGPPGCSKTLIAKATAGSVGLNFISVKGPELLSKWVGESEKAVRELFRKARQASPCIVFFDEIDAIGGSRNTSSTSSGVGERVLAQLLTELDGVELLKDVFILGATNRPDLVDPALTRPGRLDRIVHVPLPDKRSRREIFRVHLRSTPSYLDSEAEGLDELAEMTGGYSGAEIAAVCHEAALMALTEDINADRLQRRHFHAALELLKPRITAEDLQVYDRYHKKDDRP
ncbi:unnamed protein product [Cyprideis torosa]|uniref:Uncharacterized protein n=1 Tax=Cyprideis torosa TaxID=163714 RepID=A0A7R8ZML7_9CRUS|nr:unnamed protein product [Cyprideis torosa]CAG0895759.1 unnamed protein product [Cyprideis torosa]